MFFVIHVQYIVVLFHGLTLKNLYAYAVIVMVIPNHVHLHQYLTKISNLVKEQKIVVMKLVVAVIQQALSHPVSISAIYV